MTTKPTLAPPDLAGGFRPAGAFPETPESCALALLYLIVEQDRSLTSRTSNQPVATYLLDLYGRCLDATTDRWRGSNGRETLQ